MQGTVYTETVIHIAPEAFVHEAPYQMVIVDLDAGSRVTGRVDGERVVIGDRVDETVLHNGVRFFRKRA